ncbi:hypothetical protein [Streptomyces dubilierae]|uniref:Alpha/beta hydrolase n=1 Tax=Streptomyces dubilierae TaxID=3075533 RepID=A0ABU2P5A3_9ACTN|nr:hypothetical protein [Streptomyces sp. DSM 41921]MDT0385965.1 hypothetical protein [Streptomyces sp. DSM 41921]
MGGEHPVMHCWVRSRDPRPRPQAVGQRQAGRGVRRGEVEDRASQQRAHVQDRAQEEPGVQDADLAQVDELRPWPPAGRLDVAAQQARHCAADRAGPPERPTAGVGVDGHDQLPQQARDVVLGQAGRPLPLQDLGQLRQRPMLGVRALAQARFFQPVVKRILVSELKQVHWYLDEPPVWQAARAAVAAEISADTRVVVAHSLGSVVAYEALCENADWPVTDLVTAHCAPAADEAGQGAALFFLEGDLPREDVAVDIRVDGGEDQALQFARFQGFGLPLHRAGGVEVVAAGEAGPAGVAALGLGGGQLVLEDLVAGEQHPFDPAPAAGALHPVAFDVLARAVKTTYSGGAGRGSRAVRSTYDWEPKPRTTRTGMLHSASQPMSSWRRASYSAATYSTCFWLRCGAGRTSRRRRAGRRPCPATLTGRGPRAACRPGSGSGLPGGPGRTGRAAAGTSTACAAGPQRRRAETAPER